MLRIVCGAYTLILSKLSATARLDTDCLKQSVFMGMGMCHIDTGVEVLNARWRNFFV